MPNLNDEEDTSQLEWRGDTTTDGRFAIESEHVKGEGRLYRLIERVGERWEPTGIGSDDKRHIKRMAEKLDGSE